MVQDFLGLTRPMQDADGIACFTVNTAAGRIALNEILQNIRRTILLVDLDGSFWDPVRWPKRPLIVCQIPRLFSRLGRHRLFMMAYLTGRASEQLRSFGMLVRGVVAWCQFGAERWQDGKQVDLVPVPPGLEAAKSELDGTPYSVERKTHAVAVHWTAADVDSAVELLLTQQQTLADQHLLAYHPGNLVVELSPLGMSKKVSAACFARQFLPAEVIEGFVREFTPVEQGVYEQIWASLEASGTKFVPSLQSPYFIFVGDSAPDMGVFLLLDYLRGLGIPVLKVAVKGNNPYKPLEDLADIVVDGPAGALQFVRELELHTAPWWLRFLRRSLGHAA